MMVIAIVLTGCSDGTPTGSSADFTGNWTMTNTTTSSSIIGIGVGSTTTAKCNITDNNGSLAIHNFRIVGQEFIKWDTGYGTRIGNNLTANVSGSYINIYRDPVSLTIYFEGDINANGISGTGYWTQTYNIYGLIDSASGATVFVKG